MIRTYDEKKEFLEYCQDLARRLEDKTNEFIEIQIGWIDDNGLDLPVTIMVNHDSSWFGCFEKTGWNENVIWNKVNHFIPVSNDYLALNDLVEKVYGQYYF